MGFRRLALALVSASVACHAPLAPVRAQDVERAALATAMASGRSGPAVERAYADYAVAHARQACGERVASEFWVWLGAHPRVRDVVVWATVVEPGPKVIVCLDRLRRAHGDAVAALPDLAVGFALAWSAGEGDDPRRAWESWTRGRSPIPTMEESFAWYVEHSRRLAFPIRSASWQLLAYTALNDVPLDEREWVLKRYRGKRPAELRSVFAEVPYLGPGLDGKALTLANMIEHGGVCTVNTQYQMAVYRTLGFPATYGGGPGHCWPCWIAPDGGGVAFDRVNELGNADGTLGEWGMAGHVRESDLRLLARALARGKESLRTADLGAAAYRAVSGGGGDPAAAFRVFAVLDRALARNPFAIHAWLALAEGVARGHTPVREVAARLRELPAALAEFPFAALRVLRAATPDRQVGAFDSRLAEVHLANCAQLSALDGFGVEAERVAVEFLQATGSERAAAGRRLGLLVRERGPSAERGKDGDAAGTDAGRLHLLGGSGGDAFEERLGATARLVGFRYTMGEYFGHRVLSSIQPLFRVEGRIEAGRTFGRVRGEPSDLTAGEGFEVVGVEARSGDVFDGMSLVCARSTPIGVDLTDLQFSGWTGGRDLGWGTLLGGSGARVVGVHGRSGALIDAFGLILDEWR